MPANMAVSGQWYCAREAAKEEGRIGTGVMTSRCGNRDRGCWCEKVERSCGEMSGYFPLEPAAGPQPSVGGQAC